MQLGLEKVNSTTNAIAVTFGTWENTPLTEQMTSGRQFVMTRDLLVPETKIPKKT
jgi:hypothetical protein